MSAELRAEGIAKHFGGVRALENASVQVRPGRVMGLIGRNGSGKTTLFNCITGFFEPDAGRVWVDGHDLTGRPPDRLVLAGVARTFQTPRIHARATVRDAVACGAYGRGRAGFLASIAALPAARADERRIRQQAEDLMARLGLAELAQHEIGHLSMGMVRLVEVARSMAAGARYLLLDEPAAGLSAAEQGALARQVRTLADEGVGVLLVEHNFALVRRLCDDVTVLDSGCVIAAGAPEAVARDERVVATYLGVAAAAEGA